MNSTCFKCGGTGYISITEHVDNKDLKRLWKIQHNKHCSLAGKLKYLWKYKELRFWVYKFTHWNCDGWHFAECLDCHGTGTKND